MRSTIDNLATGFAPDAADIVLPDGVFTDSRNFRFRDGAAEKTKGTMEVFGSLSSTAIWLSSVTDGLTQYWAYGNEQAIFATDGATHAQISTVSYAASLDLGYTGGPFHGFMVVNDAAHNPQTWLPGSLSNKLTDLVNWPASTTAKVIRAFDDFLFALRVTESGTYNPRLLRWSDIAGVGALPPSWDYTDPTNSSGRTELGQTQDDLIDCGALGDVLIVYKQNCTWVGQPIGGLDVFQFRQIFSESGLLSEDCFKAIGGQHFVVTDSDVILHDGANIQSLVDKKMRRWLFNILSSTNYKRSFVVPDYKEREMWFCFPTANDTFATLALVWDWAQNTLHVRDLGSPMAAGYAGIVGSGALTWSGDTNTWDTEAGIWDQVNFAGSTKRPVITHSAAPIAYQGNTGETLDGVAMNCYATRSNIGLTRDVSTVKRVKRVFPKVYGTAGDSFQVAVGGANTPDAMVTWSALQTLIVGQDYKIDCRISGRFISLQFLYGGTNTIKFAGFDIEFDGDGNR